MSESKQPFWDIVTTLTEYHEFLLERSAEYGELVKNNAPFGSVMLNAARELARLHASNADLLAALRELDDADRLVCEFPSHEIPAGKCKCVGCMASAAIAKATGAA